MSIASLKTFGETKLRRRDRQMAFAVLGGDPDAVAKIQNRTLRTVSVAKHLGSAERILVHRALLPRHRGDDFWYEDGEPYRWAEWNPITVDRVLPGNVWLCVPKIHHYAIGTSEFILAVIADKVRDLGG